MVGTGRDVDMLVGVSDSEETIVASGTDVDCVMGLGTGKTDTEAVDLLVATSDDGPGLE